MEIKLRHVVWHNSCYHCRRGRATGSSMGLVGPVRLGVGGLRRIFRRIPYATEGLRFPVPPRLQELGFLDYVAEVNTIGQFRPRPKLKHQRDGYGQACSKSFGTFCDREVVDDPKKVSHSFRQNFTNGLKQAGVQVSTIAEPVGHHEDRRG